MAFMVHNGSLAYSTRYVDYPTNTELLTIRDVLIQHSRDDYVTIPNDVGEEPDRRVYRVQRIDNEIFVGTGDFIRTYQVAAY